MPGSWELSMTSDELQKEEDLSAASMSVPFALPSGQMFSVMSVMWILLFRLVPEL